MKKRVGILTSGGDCPGLNATIRGVAKALYARMGDNVEIVGILNGYHGLINGEYREMCEDDFRGIPCAVVVRFFPTVQEDYHQIRNAMALRGIAEGKGALLLHPMQSLEYILMPLLMNGNNVAQDLSVAALTKGIGLPGTHTCMTELHLTVWDFIYPALCTLPLLWNGGILL